MTVKHVMPIIKTDNHNTLKAKIALVTQLAMSNGRKTVTKDLISHLGITNLHLKRGFITINVVIPSGATDKSINPRHWLYKAS